MNISYFEKGITSTVPTREISPELVAELIAKPQKSLIEATKQLRRIKEKGERNKLKSKFTYVTWSGTFKTRCESGLIKHSGLIVLDIDDIGDVRKLRERIKTDKYTHIIFVSPSGTGLKVVVKIPPEAINQASFFNALRSYYKNNFQVDLDESGKDVSRACYVCHDPNVFYNKDSELWVKKVQSQGVLAQIGCSELMDYIGSKKYEIYTESNKYFKIVCPKCSKPDCYLYKNSWIIKCSHKTCEYEENIPAEMLPNSIELFKTNKQRKSLRYGIYKILEKMDEIEREVKFKEIKSILGVSLSAVKKDFYNYIQKPECRDFKSTDGINYVAPESYMIGSGGILLNGKPICYKPFFVSGTGECANSETSYLEITYLHQGVMKKRIVERNNLFITKELLELARYGVPVTSGNSLHLINFLDAWYNTNEDLFPHFHVTTQCGWNDDAFVLPNRIIGESDKLHYTGSIPKTSYKKKGTLQGWLKTVSKLKELKNGHVARFCFYAAFASVVLKPLDIKNFIIHMHSSTSKGKTTTIKIAASIFGKPDFDGCMIRWANTKNFIIRYMEGLGNLPLFIDEISSENKAIKKTFDDIVYLIESGISKGKASRTDANAVEKQRYFSLGTISSGEPPMVTDSSLGGVAVRTMQFAGNPIGEDNGPFIQEIEAGIKANYGHAVDLFVQNFQKDSTHFLNHENLNHFETKSNMEKRISYPLNVILLTGAYVNEIFKLDFPVEKDLDKIFEMLKKPLKKIEESAFGVLEFLKDHLTTKQHYYPKTTKNHGTGRATVKGKMTNDVYGYILDKGDVGFIRSNFMKIFDEEINISGGGIYALNILKESDLIQVDQDRVRIDGLYPRLLVFKNLMDIDLKGNEDEKNENPF